MFSFNYLIWLELCVKWETGEFFHEKYVPYRFLTLVQGALPYVVKSGYESESTVARAL
jgi:hypothetical protein